MSAPRPRWRLTKPLRDRIARGHPWIYDRALAPVPKGVVAGDLVTIVDDDGPIATAFADPGSPLRARVIGEVDAVIDPTWIRARAQAAASRRARDPLLVGCTGRRIIHGEGDACPGLVVDVYADTAVVVFDGEASSAFWRPCLADVIKGITAGGIAIEHVWVRAVRGVTSETRTASAFRGDPPAEITISEDEARFVVDVRHGQKTGFFLDQRENRRTIRRHAGGATVLNLFSYSGGFSLHAALGGATKVTSVDIAPAAIEALGRNVALSGLEPQETAVADVFDFLGRATRQRRRWDLVIVDPPSFAPNERAKPNAMAAYRKLAMAALEVTETGGRFALASCSSHVTEPELLEMMAGVPRSAQLRISAGAASDHPVVPGFAEGRYLKFLFFDV